MYGLFCFKSSTMVCPGEGYNNWRILTDENEYEDSCTTATSEEVERFGTDLVGFQEV